MPLRPETRALLDFLRKHPLIREQIAAKPGATVLYAGKLIKPAWKEIAEWRIKNTELSTKQTLPDVLKGIKLSGQPFPSLLEWVKSIDSLGPWEENGFIAWRALSGIFASNATGSVSFVIGSEVKRQTKVFAATEAAVLARNPNVDKITKDLLDYYQRCIKAGKSDLCVSYISA
jgi:hypothetical protein